jgi:NDP-sugar pyrophosphorylase family protein
MKAVMFAGGLVTRISEETDLKLKPMIPIGGMPHFVAHHENVRPPCNQ